MNLNLPVWLRASDSANSYILALYCQPGAKKTEVQGEHDGRLKIRLAAPPVDGKANDVLVLWLSKQLHINRSSIELIAGELSRLKRVKIDGIPAELILQLLFDS
jgi:uncharacterized protein (TIGR00251 family)